MLNAATQGPVTARSATLGATLTFDALDTPGTYVCNWNGHLLRVTQPAVAAGAGPAFNFVGSEPLTVTKISDDPYVPINEAKRLAKGFQLAAQF